MGTCMSKDKKGATVAAHTTHASTTSSSSLSSSAQEKSLGQEAETASAPAKSAEKLENVSSTITARHSAEESSKEAVSTDKHVVEIRLPIASPNKFKASPSSATLAAKAVAAIARPPEEDRGGETVSDDSSDVEDEERDTNSRCDVRKSSLPLFYSTYLSGASFSRDIAAFSRDIASLSGSPLKRSPSVNGAQDLIAAAIKVTNFSPQYGAHAKPHPDMANDDYPTNTRSRSLPKRFYGKGSQNGHHAGGPPLALLHKRSSSRDAVCISSMALSPRLAVRREEASGEYRVCARQAAARRSAASSFTQHSTVAPPISSRIKERSPSNRRSSCSSTAKLAVPSDVDYTSAQDVLHFQENRISSPLQPPVHAHDKMRGRTALKDKSTNCSTWVDDNSYGVKCSFKDQKKAFAETKVEEDSRENAGIDSDNSDLHHQGLYRERSQLECPNPPLYSSGKPCFVDSSQCDDALMYSASMHRVQSLIKALAEMNMENSLLSQVEESETEVESELDLIRFAFDARLSPRKELQAQQARNLLLKEAAMDAFARPSFHTNDMDAIGLHEGKQPPPDLAALMSTRLPNSETHSSKIREVLMLLSVAESEMGTEQKTLFYNQLRMVLDSVKTPTSAKENTQGGAEFASNMAVKSVTARANSWPRSIKEPTHIVMSVEGNSTEAVNTDVNRDSSTDIIKSLEGQQGVATDQQLAEQSSLKQSVAALCGKVSDAQASELCKCEVLGDPPSITQNHGGINIISGLPMEGLDLDRLNSKHCRANEESGHFIQQTNEQSGHFIQQTDRPLNVDVGSEPHMVQTEQESIKEIHWSDEGREKSSSEIHNGIGDMPLESGFHCDITQAPDLGISECMLTKWRDAEDFKGVGDVLHSTSMEAKEMLLSDEAQLGHTAAIVQQEMLDLPEISQSRCADLPEISQSRCAVCPEEDSVHHSPQSSRHCGEADVVSISDSVLRKGDDVGSDGSFEFRPKSTVSTPLSTPSTPMLSTASTPRHINQTNTPLTAKEIAEIWEAFD